MINEKYSYKNFQNQNFSKLDAKDFEGEIIGSCFYQENKPKSGIFPKGIKTTFNKCNLDNVKVDCEMIDCTNKQMMVQNDLSDWIIDENGNPIEPIDKSLREEKGISCKSEDIPPVKQTKTVFDKLDK